MLKAVKRSLSFDRKKSGSVVDGGKPAFGHEPPTAGIAVRRTFVLERGEAGLGLELDGVNTVVNIKPGGRAERQGLMMVGDTVLTIDGKSCAGTLMQKVMVPGRPVYVVEISRPERRVGVAPKSGAVNAIRRSLSFDSRRSSTVKRSFSFERKK